MKKLTIVLFSVILLACSNSPNDVKYNEIYVKLFDIKLSYSYASKLLDNILEREVDFKNGMILYPEENKGYKIEEQRIIRKDKYVLEFKPTTEEIDSANGVINKINNARPLIQKIASLSEQTTILYKAGNKSDLITKIIKHPDSEYASMERNFQEISKTNDELKVVLQMTLADFIISLNNKEIENLMLDWMRRLDK